MKKARLIVAAAICLAATTPLFAQLRDVPRDVDVIKLDTATLDSAANGRKALSIALLSHWVSQQPQGWPTLAIPDEIPFMSPFEGSLTDEERALMRRRVAAIMEGLAAMTPLRDEGIAISVSPHVYKVEEEDVNLGMTVSVTKDGEEARFGLYFNPANSVKASTHRIVGPTPGGCQRQQVVSGAFAGEESLIFGKQTPDQGMAVRGFAIGVNNSNWQALFELGSAEAVAGSIQGRVLAALYGLNCQKVLELANVE